MSKDEPLVSIIVPVYNAEKTIGRTINSILSQSYRNIEIIIVDDGSVDNTKEIISKIKDDRLVYVKKNNSGVSASRNLGIDKSNGKYIMFCDADDELSNSAVSVLVSVAKRQKVSVVKFGVLDVFSKCQKKESMGNLAGRRVESSLEKGLIYEKFFYCEAQQKCLVMALFLDRDFIEKNNLRFNDKLFMMEDVVFYVDIVDTGCAIYFYDEPLYKYYHYQNSVSHSKKKAMRIAQGIYESNNTICLRINDAKINAAHFRAYFQRVILNYDITHRIEGLNIARKLAKKSDLLILPLYWRLVGECILDNKSRLLKILIICYLLKDQIRSRVNI